MDHTRANVKVCFRLLNGIVFGQNTVRTELKICVLDLPWLNDVLDIFPK